MSLRDHGYGDSPQVEGVPAVLAETDIKCPNCGCTTYSVQVGVKNPPDVLHVPEGHRAVGRYLGCPACPWAGPMVTTSIPSS